MSKKIKMARGSKLVFLTSIIAMVGSAGGGMANVFCMRRVELKNGIDVEDPNTGEPVGKSKSAAQMAVGLTAASRVFLAMPVALPGIILTVMEKRQLLPKNK